MNLLIKQAALICLFGSAFFYAQAAGAQTPEACNLDQNFHYYCKDCEKRTSKPTSALFQNISQIQIMVQSTPAKPEVEAARPAWLQQPALNQTIKQHVGQSLGACVNSTEAQSSIITVSTMPETLANDILGVRVDIIPATTLKDMTGLFPSKWTLTVKYYRNSKEIDAPGKEARFSIDDETEFSKALNLISLF